MKSETEPKKARPTTAQKKNSPLERQKHSDSFWKRAVDLVLQHRVDDLVGNVLRLQHGEEPRLHAGEHAGVDVIRADERHCDVVVAVSAQLAEKTFVKSNASELGGRVVSASVSAEQSRDGADGDDVPSLVGDHVRKERLRRLK